MLSLCMDILLDLATWNNRTRLLQEHRYSRGCNREQTGNVDMKLTRVFDKRRRLSIVDKQHVIVCQGSVVQRKISIILV